MKAYKGLRTLKSIVLLVPRKGRESELSSTGKSNSPALKGVSIMLKGYICVVMCITVAIAGISGCVLPSSSQLSQSEQLLEGIVDFGDVGLMPACYLTLNEPHLVSRIVIHTNYPVKGIEVYVAIGKDKWQRVKQFRRPISSGTHINIGRKTDVIRVITKHRNPGGYVQNIEAFGY